MFTLFFIMTFLDENYNFKIKINFFFMNMCPFSTWEGSMDSHGGRIYISRVRKRNKV